MRCCSFSGRKHSIVINNIISKTQKNMRCCSFLGRKHSIVIKNATVHHEGEYVASVGEQECSCELTVIGKKKITLVSHRSLIVMITVNVIIWY
jgi:hypothetical protein